MKLQLSLVSCAIISCFNFSSHVLADDIKDTSPTSRDVDEVVVITASRVEKPLSQIPNTITVIDTEELEQQLSIQHDISTVLGNLVPSFSPSRQKMSGSGETMRGRSPLYLIDGVPQSNPLRDGGRDGHTIDPFLLERIEVLHGANAIHGLGAAGGIINLITRKPTKEFEQKIKIDTQFQPEDIGESASFGVSYSLANRWKNSDLLMAFTLRDTGMAYDADGEIVGVDNTQGDTMDTSTFDGFIKAGYEWEDSRVELMVNQYQIKGNNSWVSVAGDVDADIPSTAVKGDIIGDPAKNKATTASINYSKQDFLGQSLSIKVFHQDFAATYGAQVSPIATFQDAEYGENLIDQSQNNSEKTGMKVTFVNDELMQLPISLVYGFDILQDQTWQALVQTGRTWVPETQYINYAPYAQVEYSGITALNITAGVRHEVAKLDVDDFTTLASYGSQFVEGGSPEFSETLINLGGTYKLNDNWRVFANYAEAFSMPDVGRVLRGINIPNQSVEFFLDLKPILTENTELGLEYRGNDVQAQLTYYTSESDFGQRLEPDEDGIYSVKREMTEVDGFEFSADWAFSLTDSLGLRYANSDGRYDSDENGSVDSDLGGSDISPDRINISWDSDWNDILTTRLQVNHLLDRKQRNSDNDIVNEFDGYTTVDFSANIAVFSGQVTLAIQNLTNTDYYSYYSQSNPNDLRNFKGIGRSFSAAYQISF
ncbi:TonB-dependent receptor [Colwellia sp. 1_MG-2023]|uniref:TonB-dependent receptor n=1 Tax=unclassified Colwellia TaxID=196834 RepID=UPI001C09E495|nr:MULTISPECIES: TonB-dependent receptor [unclassified Colwellia]MBU2925332.1 TonB-dependent receptor [Colwellia sp. C2M11]MDO6650762.1 TonB-dependent receptor [Colwellia sp. 3_MG-2023]MDO6663797.1 TonB-dependent receptor [Colwellia sp. 2_MG-2023]MDO6688148.1 TonB-dependent receptor [Colwellia sp. 1_MG-2023]